MLGFLMLDTCVTPAWRARLARAVTVALRKPHCSDSAQVGGCAGEHLVRDKLFPLRTPS